MKDAYDYKILKNIEANELAKDVVKSFREGWEPVGGRIDDHCHGK